MAEQRVVQSSGLNMDRYRKRQRAECQRQIEIARDREAWALWLAALRARVWVARGRMCEHGGSRAGERAADETHAADWYARQRKTCEATVRILRPPLPVLNRHCLHPMHDDDCRCGHGAVR